jgi:MFS family permease
MARPIKPPPVPAAALHVDSAWRPLRLQVFRWIWIATLVSNIGTWMQTVGAQWLLVGQPHASALVALVQTATTLPVVLFALPAGVLADLVDRRRLLIGGQVFQTVVAGLMAVLSARGNLHPAVLLGLTFLLGCGATFSLPAQQAIIPDLVPRADLASASALGGMNMNLARAIGPALAGAAVARLGASAVFGLNAVSFMLFAVVLAVWRPARAVVEGREHLGAALLAGTRYIRHSPVIRRILLTAALFSVPASAVWALLPVVASHRLGLGAGGYGVLLGALGVGAVGGALALPRLRAGLSDARMLLLAFCGYAAVMVAIASTRSTPLVAFLLVPAGVAWIAVLATLNAEMQLFLPGWVRARGLSIYQVVLLGGMALASAGWGLVAEQTGLAGALFVAGGLLAVTALALVRWPLADVGHLDRSPAIYWAEPHLVLEPSPEEPVLVSVTYTVAPGNVAQFLKAMERVRRSRRRTGATRWELYREGEHPQQFVELYLVRSWEEHLRQHGGRLTGTDRELEQVALALAEGPTVVAHLFPPDDEPDDEPRVEQSDPSPNRPIGKDRGDGGVPS